MSIGIQSSTNIEEIHKRADPEDDRITIKKVNKMDMATADDAPRSLCSGGPSSAVPHIQRSRPREV